MTQALGPTRAKSLMKYQGVASLTRESADDIIRTLWPKAPAAEVKKAIEICVRYNYNPLLKHLYILGPFKDSKTGDQSWAIALGIKCTLLNAARQRRFSYLDDSPRIMNEDEQKKIRGKVETHRIWAITKLKDESGNLFQGIGFWPADSPVYGADKGNTPENMAMIRSQRQALDRMCPEAVPQGVQFIDEQYMPDPGANVNTRVINTQVVNKETGEIGDEPPEELFQDTGQSENSEANKLLALEFKNPGEFYQACFDKFKLIKSDVEREISMYELSKPDQRKKAWEQVVGVYGQQPPE